jgi:hypothetical protein
MSRAVAGRRRARWESQRGPGITYRPGSRPMNIGWKRRGILRVDYWTRAKTRQQRERSQLEYRSMLHRRIHQLQDAIDHFGLFDRRGKLRALWLSMLKNFIAEARALDALLGLTADREPCGRHRRIRQPQRGREDR